MLTKHIGTRELQEQLTNLGMINLDQNSEVLAGLHRAQALQVASILTKEARYNNRTNDASKNIHPWKPRYATAISTLQAVTAASLLRGSEGEIVHERRETECGTHEVTYSENYGRGLSTAMTMLGILLIITIICTLCVKIRKNGGR